MGDRYRRRDEDERGGYRRRDDVDDRDRFQRDKRRREDDDAGFRRGPPGAGRDRELTEKIYIRDDRALPGRIIGKEGAIIKRIERESRCRVNIVTPKKPGDEAPHVSVSGAPEDISRAREEIMKVIHQYERENNLPLSDGSPGGFNGPPAAPSHGGGQNLGNFLGGAAGGYPGAFGGMPTPHGPPSPRQQGQQQQLQQHPLYTALQEKFKKEQEELVQKYKAREDNENARHQAELKAITDELSAELKTLSERQHTQKMEFEKNLKTLLAAVLQQAPGPAGGGMSGAFPSQQPVMQYGPGFSGGQPQGMMMGGLQHPIPLPQAPQQSPPQQASMLGQMSGPGQRGAGGPSGFGGQGGHGGHGGPFGGPGGAPQQSPYGPSPGGQAGPRPPAAPAPGMAPSPYGMTSGMPVAGFGAGPASGGLPPGQAPLPSADQISMLQAILAAQKQQENRPR